MTDYNIDNITHTESSEFDLKKFIESTGSTISGVTTPYIYVVIKDGVPSGYLKNIKMARQYMWYLARSYKDDIYYKYITFIREGNSRNKIQITGRYSFFGFSYDRIFSNFEIYKIKEIIPENGDTDCDIFQDDEESNYTMSDTEDDKQSNYTMSDTEDDKETNSTMSDKEDDKETNSTMSDADDKETSDTDDKETSDIDDKETSDIDDKETSDIDDKETSDIDDKETSDTDDKETIICQSYTKCELNENSSNYEDVNYTILKQTNYIHPENTVSSNHYKSVYMTVTENPDKKNIPESKGIFIIGKGLMVPDNLPSTRRVNNSYKTYFLDKL
jgi:hypothetical protein